MKARSALFTLFGDVVRPVGGEAWLSSITACMATLGFRGQTVRTALHRMGGEGWVEPRKEGRYAAYRLTERGTARLDEAAARIYRLRSLDWDGSWRLLLAAGLDDSGVVAELEWLGYGRLQDGVWALPHPHPDGAAALVEGAGSIPTLVTGARVVDDSALARTAWALDDLRLRHQAFLDDWAEVTVPADGAGMMGLRLRLVHHWRSFLFHDPGLPAEVLPADWPGLEAARRFAEVYEAVREGSWAWFAEQQDAVAAPVTATAAAPTANPFAQGLAAMQRR